jgi:transposase
MTNKSYKVYVGIDVSKAKLDVSISGHASLLQFSNDETGLKALVKLIPSKKNSLVILEATGGYEKVCATYLRQKKCNVAVVNAKRVRDFAKACGKLAKTDGIDAEVIRHFGQTFNPIPQVLVPEEADKRQVTIHRRDQLVRMIATEKRYREHSNDWSRKSIKKHIDFLEEELACVEKLLEEQFTKDPVLKDKLTRLDAIKGVGVVTAMNILIHLPELGSLTSREVSALAGVAPFNKDSGKSKGKREIWGGRAPVRSALYMSVLSAKKSNVAIKLFYERLLTKGKLKKVAMVACMRKLLIMMNAIIRDGTEWKPICV